MNTLKFLDISKKFHKQIKLVLTCLVFLSFPLANNLNSLSIIVLTGYSLINIKKLNLNKIKNLKYMIFYFGLMCFSLLYTNNLDEGFKYILKFLPFLIFPLIFSILEFNKDEIIKIFNYFTIWMCCLIIYAELITIYQIIEDNNSLYLIFRKDFSYINLGNKIDMHPHYIALYLSFCIFYLITFFTKNKLPKIINILMLIFMLFFLVHLSSRLPLVAAFTIGFIIYSIELRKRFNTVKTIALCTLPIILISFFLFNVRATKNRFQELVGMKYSSGLYIESGPKKLDQWKAGIQANKNFVFGEGIGDADESIKKSNFENKLYKNFRREYNAHNQFIQTYVGIGIIGVIMLISIIYFNGFVLTKEHLKLLFYSFSTYLLIVFLSESYLERHNGIVFICLILSLASSNEKIST